MQIIGKTRSGKDIYVDFIFDQHGQIQFIFPDFDQFEDDLEAIVVFDFVAIREFRRGIPNIELRMRLGMTHFQQMLLHVTNDDPFILNPAQRIALARQLVRPEFLE